MPKPHHRRDDDESDDDDLDDDRDDDLEGGLDLETIDRADPELRDLANQVEVLRALIPSLRHRLKQEHRAGPPPLEVLEGQLEASSRRLEQTDEQLAQLKSSARAEQTGADEWMRWYDQQPREARGAGWETVEAELLRRNRELQAVQEKIAVGEQERLKVVAEVGQAKEQLMAARAGVHEKGVGADPRLKSAKKALREAKKELRRALRKRRRA